MASQDAVYVTLLVLNTYSAIGIVLLIDLNITCIRMDIPTCTKSRRLILNIYDFEDQINVCKDQFYGTLVSAQINIGHCITRIGKDLDTKSAYFFRHYVIMREVDLKLAHY